MGRQRGFTLVEALVVLGILVFLFSILVPAVRGVRKQAKRTECQARLRQIGHAFRMYLNDNHGRYPRAPALPGVNPDKHPTLMDSLGKYVGKDLSVFHCPADDALHLVHGTSYFYYHELGVKRIEETFLSKMAGTVGKVPILWDAGDFHGESPASKNWLFADGRVGTYLTESPRRSPLQVGQATGASKPSEGGGS